MNVLVVLGHRGSYLLIFNKESDQIILSNDMGIEEAFKVRRDIELTYGDDFNKMLNYDEIAINGFGRIEVDGVAGYDVKICGVGFNIDNEVRIK